MSTSDIIKLQEEQERKQARSLWEDAVIYILHDKLTIGAIIVLVLMTLFCVLGPPILQSTLGIEATDTSIPDRFLSPGTEGHLLGTDQLGRDQLARLMYGGRISLAIAFSASLMTITIGVTLGLIAGYYGGWIDDIIAWLINTLSSIPSIFLLLIAAALWSPSPELLIVVLALTGWLGTSRLVRGEVFSIKERDYVLAAQALGTTNRRLLIFHVLPNVLPIVIVTMTIIAGNLILIESGLSYLGVGVQPPVPSWGNMLTEARSYFQTGVHLVLWPGLLIMVTVLCFYLIGDGLRDALDPRTSGRELG